MIKREPFDDLVLVRDHMNRILEAAIDRNRGGELGAGWSFPVDIYEYPDHVVVAAELPGLDLAKVEVRADGRTVTIRGSRRIDRQASSESYQQLERFQGPFARSFELPTDVISSSVERRYERGVLEVRLSKARPAAESRRKKAGAAT